MDAYYGYGILILDGAGEIPLHFFMCSQEHTFTNTRNHPVFRVRNI